MFRSTKRIICWKKGHLTLQDGINLSGYGEPKLPATLENLDEKDKIVCRIKHKSNMSAFKESD